ncbi:unnamed protein product [Closterium sp. NIES-65]|nr:unnamed protein product [Closterium sp. NIES-65]
MTLATALRFLLSSAPRTPPPMDITLYYIVTRLPDSLRVVKDHFLSVCPTTLTVDLLKKGLLAAEKNIVAVGASRGDPRTPVFEGCSPSPLLPFIASAAAADLVGVAIFDLDYDAILAAMYFVTTIVEGDSYLCVPFDPGIEATALSAGEAAALGASASAAPGASASAAPSACESALSGTTSA